MKVSYAYKDDVDRVSTAYLDDVPLSDGSYVGTNKHTDMPVHVTWVDSPKIKVGWIEVCHRHFDYVGPLLESFEEDIEARSDPNCLCLKERDGSNGL